MLADEIKKHNKEVKSRTNFSKVDIDINEDILKELRDKEKIKDYYYDDKFILINGECIETMNSLIDKGVVFDHIVTDIPYGTIQGLSIEGWKNKGNIPMWDRMLL